MPRKYFTPANRTVIFTGFREDLEVSAIHEFCHQSLSVEPSLSAGLADQGISVTSGKVYINFKDCVAARRAITVLSKLSVDEICSPGSHIEIWLKELGRSSSVSSPISSKKGGNSSEIPEGATKKDFRRLPNLNIFQRASAFSHESIQQFCIRKKRKNHDLATCMSMKITAR
jgi:hypothetical protein